MCGIAGIINLQGRAVDEGELQVLTDALVHRGPDGRGQYTHGSVGLGHRRLKIIDLSEAAAQPMPSHDGVAVVTFNGEIYNFQELRAELQAKGVSFRSTGDTEVLVELYRMHGKSFVSMLRGMFAFALYDKEKQTVLLARDRVGKKPLKYFSRGGVFAFASELKALRTHPLCPRETDMASVFHALTMMYVPSPSTGISGIYKLPPAHTLTVDVARGVVGEPERYWELRYTPKQHYFVDEWQERIFSVFEESTRLRMISDVPLGAFLSGGIDSAAVVSMMARHSSRPLETFSIGTSEETHNELPYAEITAKFIGANHHPIVVDPDIVSLLPELVAAYEEPYGDPSAIPTYLISKLTRQTVTVALNGDGGDENFAGYVRYPILAFASAYEKIPRPLHVLMELLTKVAFKLHPTTFTRRCHRFQASMNLPWEQRYLEYLSFFTSEEKKQILSSDVFASFPETDEWYAALTQRARLRAEDRVEQAMSADLETYLEGDLMPKVDLGTMAHGLEARSPLLDHTLLELTASMPREFKLRGLQRKWIFRRALKGVVPSEILTKKKTGFRLPLDAWFRGSKRAFLEERLRSPSSKLWRICDLQAVGTFLDTYFASEIDFSDHLWMLLWLDEWLRQYAPD